MAKHTAQSKYTVQKSDLIKAIVDVLNNAGYKTVNLEDIVKAGIDYEATFSKTEFGELVEKTPTGYELTIRLVGEFKTKSMLNPSED